MIAKQKKVRRPPKGLDISTAHAMECIRYQLSILGDPSAKQVLDRAILLLVYEEAARAAALRQRLAEQKAAIEFTPAEIRVLRRVLEVLTSRGACWQSIAFDLDREEKIALPAVMVSLTEKLAEPRHTEVNV